MAPTLAVFGATGDCAGYCLAAALNDGYTCTALARTPSKLTASLQAKGVSPSSLQNLTIIRGDAHDVNAIKDTLRLPSGRLVDKIVSGIGGTLVFQWSLWQPFTLTDPTICQSTGSAILQALQELKAATKPVLINISTTGITSPSVPRDVPWAFLPLYHLMLNVPHDDKAVFEQKLAKHMSLAESERGLGFYINVRPSLLTHGPGMGLSHVREGIDGAPAVGYTIRREDVGRWIFARLIQADKIEDSWRNTGVTITY